MAVLFLPGKEGDSMADKSKPLTIPDKSAPAVQYPGMPSGNQNVQPDSGYVGGGSAPLSNKGFWTDKNDLHGGH
jgi:hypothetical protein